MSKNDDEYITLVGAVRPYVSNSLVVPVQKGNWYAFRYRARNMYGWGPFTSTPLRFLAATTPAAPAAPIITNIDSS